MKKIYFHGRYLGGRWAAGGRHHDQPAAGAGGRGERGGAVRGGRAEWAGQAGHA